MTSRYAPLSLTVHFSSLFPPDLPISLSLSIFLPLPYYRCLFLFPSHTTYLSHKASFYSHPSHFLFFLISNLIKISRVTTHHSSYLVCPSRSSISCVPQNNSQLSLPQSLLPTAHQDLRTPNRIYPFYGILRKGSSYEQHW